jgi:hypothetical protein
MTTRDYYNDAVKNAAVITTLDYAREISSINFEVKVGSLADAQKAKDWPLVGHMKDGYGNMPWFKIYKRQKYKSRRFFLSINESKTGDLQGLIAGRISANDEAGSTVSIDYVERSYSAVELKGHAIIIALRFAYVLCEMMEFKRVKVNNPAKGLIDIYKQDMPQSTYVVSRKKRYIEAPISLTSAA